MIAQAKRAIQLKPKVFVNGFPKAGTHLALGLVAGLVKPWREDETDDANYYLGTFKHNSFSQEWMPQQPTTWAVLCQPEGTWLKGHCGWFPELEMAFDEFGTCFVNIYRDLRDVAVSMVYHIEGDTEQFRHSERHLYQDMTHEDRLVAVIEGIGRDPGLIRRWEYFAPWLDVDWVHNIRFEDVVEDKEVAVHEALQYCISRTALHHGVVGTMAEDEYLNLVKQTLYCVTRPKEYSKTFRKGIPGEWRNEFTPRVTKAFIAAGGNDWLKRLGYGDRC